MATIRAYTTIEQSRNLADILPIESADMYYEDDISVEFGHGWHSQHIPAWSLTALLSVLPLVDFTTPQLIGTPKTLYRCMYNDDLKSHAYDNPVDACVAMIEKLHELKLL